MHQTKKKGNPIITGVKVKNNEKIETLVIRGRRWFQKLYGNTYHTVTVVVNGHVLKSNIQYGYGTQYLVTAADLLRENGYDIPENNLEALRTLKELSENDYEVVDVPRKKIYRRYNRE